MRRNILKNKNILILIFFILSGVLYVVIEYLKQHNIEEYKKDSYKENILSAKVYLMTLIKEKQNATTTIGLGLAQNEHVIEALRNKKSSKDVLQNYSKQLAKNTDFKNVWFQLITNDGISIDRSWTTLKNDNIANVRVDLQDALKNQNIVNSISVGKFDLTFKTIVPIFDTDGKKFLGVVEVITHFNSIAQKLEEKKISSVIMADPVYKKQLIYPVTKTFIGDYYVANLNLKKNILAYFKTVDMKKYLDYFKNNDYFVDNNLQSVVSYYSLIDDGNGKQLGHILLIQNTKNIDADAINYIDYIYNIYFLFALIALLLIIYLSITGEVKNIIGKSSSYSILIYICVVYIALSFGIYNLLKIKYDGDMENYNQNITSQSLLEYNSIFDKNRDIGNFVYDEVIDTPRVIELFEKRDREELYKNLQISYKRLSEKYNIRQFHFHLPDSTSFLRMHRKELYGDSLVGIRESVEYVNRTLKPFYGFEEGRIYNGFRYVYPVFAQNGTHLGSVEVSFDVKSFIDNYFKYFDVKRVNFLISEKVMEEKVFKSERTHYIKSPVKGFLYDKVVLDSLIVKDSKHFSIQGTPEQLEEISKKIKYGAPFTIHFKEVNEITIFIPIINKISGEIVACVSVSKDDSFIKHREEELNQVMIVVMIVLAFIMFFVYKEYLSKKQAQMELLNNQKILDSQNSFIIITDGIEIKRVNRTFLLFFDYPDIEAFKLEHQCICDFFVYEKGKNYILKEMDGMNWFEYIKNQTNQNRQVKILDIKKEEHIFYIEINFDDTLEDGNNIITFVDITHLKNIENQLFYSEKMASLGNMIGNIAHQWRQPLSVISTCASGIAMKHEYGILKDEDIEPNMEMIVQNTKYLSETIDTFRDFIKESGDKEQHTVSINQTITVTLSIMEATLKNHYIEILCDLPQKEYFKTMAKGEFSQVITNLINNAKDVLIERKIEQPTIEIKFLEADNHLIITIEDNAGGISDDIIQNVFEPYFTTKHKSKGTGLGLYICHKIVTESLGGKIYVKNGEYGAKFYIEMELDTI
ncbi:MAG: ATP-binding protein [Arcobacteraceae bacterium]|nr:ATP-binding protein [Arcobacteraceae bacterium]